MATILFLHGWNSKPGGVKPSYLAEHGHTVINPALPDEDFAESVRIAQAEVDRHHPDVVVGSSRGGAVAMNVDARGAALILLCPAWKKWGTATTVKRGTVILHSEADDVVPIAHSRELVIRSALPATALVIAGNDHRLADPEPLAAMLEAVERSVYGLPSARPAALAFLPSICNSPGQICRLRLEVRQNSSAGDTFSMTAPTQQAPSR